MWLSKDKTEETKAQISVPEKQKYFKVLFEFYFLKNNSFY